MDVLEIDKLIGYWIFLSLKAIRIPNIEYLIPNK